MGVQASIVMTTRNRANELYGAIHAATHQALDPNNYEVVVVDNGSEDHTKDVVHSAAANSAVPVRYCLEPVVGLHRARHAGARAAAGNILAFTEDDVVLPSSWLGSILDCFADPTVAAVVGGLKGKWLAPRPPWLDAIGTDYLGLLDLGPGTFVLPENCYFCGGNFAIRAALLFEVGGFNPDLLPAGQIAYRGDGEVGLLHKLRAANKKILYTSAAKVEHIVPANKLTLDYVSARYRREGISRAFANCRRANGNPIMILFDLLLSAVRSTYHTLIHTLLFNEPVAVRHRLIAIYLRSRARHGIRQLFDRSLRRYTLKPNFLND